MQYDPIKRSLGKVFNTTPALRKLFYSLLDLLLLRAWHINHQLRKIRKADPNKNMTILDAGSGFGQYSYRMSRLFPKATIKGVDVKTEQIEDCNQFFEQIGNKDRVSFEFADLTKFEEPNKYDIVLSVDVMEHIEEDELVFRNFHKSMKEEGLLLISTPSDQGGSDAHDHDHDHDEDDAYGFVDEHVRDGYGIEDITAKLKRAGFSKVEAKYTYGTPGKISWKLSMKFPILALGTTKLFFVLLPFYYLLTFPLCFVLNYFDRNGKHKTGTGLMVCATK